MIRDQRGLTLVEVLIVSAVLVLVVAGVGSFFTFGHKVFYTGSDQVDLHRSLRLVAERIARELRFAEKVTLLGDSFDPGAADPENQSYIYYDAGSKTVMLLDSEGSRPLSDGVITEASFSADESMKVILLFNLRGEEGANAFTLDSSVRPLNQNDDIAGPAHSQALQFSLIPGS